MAIKEQCGKSDFMRIKATLQDEIKLLKSGKKLTLKKVSLPSKPKEMSAAEIAILRKKQLNMSQHVFASLLNVSTKTVQAWEQNHNHPNGTALRLLQLIGEKPEIFTKHLVAG